MRPSPAWLAYCGTCRRIRDIMLNAPWSSFDLMTGMVVCGIGGYLLLMPGMFQAIGGVYATMAAAGPEWAWGGLFLGLGGLGLATTVWCRCPPFLTRLAARMGTAFCLLTFAINNLSHSPPPLSAVTYTLLSAWAVWGIWRTRASGR